MAKATAPIKAAAPKKSNRRAVAVWIVKREWISPGTFFAMPALGNFDEGVTGPEVRKVLDNTGLYEAWKSEIFSNETQLSR